MPDPDGPAGLLLSRDLIFTSKITGTAAALGHRVLVAGNVALVRAMLATWTPLVVFVDLGAGDLVASPTLLQYQEVAPPGTPFVAFGSHVDTEALAKREVGRLRPGAAAQPVHRRAPGPDPSLLRRRLSRLARSILQ